MPEKRYPYGRIQVLWERLQAAGVAPETVEAIMAGGEQITGSTTPEKKADWLREAMQRMNRLLPLETCLAVREACACCLGGKRLEQSKAIAKNHATLEARIAAANQTRFVFGNSVRRLEDGRILVSFVPEDAAGPFRCVCVPKAKEPLPILYCYCCGGHVKHHLQIALGEALKMKVRSSALSSGGKQPCQFEFELVSL